MRKNNTKNINNSTQKKGILPKQAARVCHDQLNAVTMAEVTDAYLLIEAGVGEHNNLVKHTNTC